MDQVPTFNTPVLLFIGILAAYIGLCLMIGGKKTYFDPYVEKPEEPEANPPQAQPEA